MKIKGNAIMRVELFVNDAIVSIANKAPGKKDAVGCYNRDPQFIFSACQDLLDKYVARREQAERQLQRAVEALNSAQPVLKVGTLNGFGSLKNAFSPETSALKDAERKAINSLWWWTKVTEMIAEEITDRFKVLESDIKYYQGISA